MSRFLWFTVFNTKPNETELNCVESVLQHPARYYTAQTQIIITDCTVALTCD